MISKIDKNADRLKRHARVRKKISGTSECPRLCVYRSLNHIYAQIIDDVTGNTLVACSTVEKAVMEMVKDMTKKEASKVVGQELAKKALAKGIENVVFDRGGYIYTGRVECLADGAREAGLKF
jgi:large subunit ribosomal protein L18